MCNNTNTVKFAPDRAKTLGEKDCFLRGICDKIKEQQAQIKMGEHSPRGECCVVHPRAYVSPSAVLEPGAVVLPMGCVGTRTVVRTGAIINMGAMADHDCDIGAYCHLAPGAVVKAGNVLPPRTKVDSGCVIGRAAEPKQGGPVHV